MLLILMECFFIGSKGQCLLLNTLRNEYCAHLNCIDYQTQKGYFTNNSVESKEDEKIHLFVDYWRNYHGAEFFFFFFQKKISSLSVALLSSSPTIHRFGVFASSLCDFSNYRWRVTWERREGTGRGWGNDVNARRVL